MAQYLEAFDYELSGYSLPYATSNGSPGLVGGLCRLPGGSIISKDVDGSTYGSFYGQNYNGNYALSFDLYTQNADNITFLVLNYGGTDLVPALRYTSGSMQFGWSSYEQGYEVTTGNAIFDGEFDGRAAAYSGTYRVTYLKRVLTESSSEIAMHVVTPGGEQIRSGWVPAADPLLHNQIGSNVGGTGFFEIGTISVIDSLSSTDLDDMLAGGELGYAGAVLLPFMEPVGGVYNEPVQVMPLCRTPFTTIYYTTDGSTPTASSPVTEGLFWLGPATTPVVVRLLATKSGLPDSDVASITYRFLCATPVASPTSALFTPGTPITLSCATAGASIYYTLDGSYPTTASTLYTSPISIGAGVTDLKCVAVATDYADSDLLYEQYTLQTSFVETWTNLNNWLVDQPSWLSLPGNQTLYVVQDNPILKLGTTVIDIFVVEVVVSTPDDALVYFIDADSTATNFYDLDVDSQQFGILFENGYAGYVHDIVLTWNNGSVQQAAIAKFTPNQSYRLLFGKINSTLMLKVFDVQTGDIVVEASHELVVSNNQIKLLVGAGRAGTTWGPMSFRSSLTQEQAEVIIDTGDVDADDPPVDPPVEVAAPVLTPSGMSVSSEVAVTMVCSTAGAEIRYTLDGTEPTVSSALYTGAVTVGPQVQPIAVGSVSVETVLGVSTPAVVLDDGKQWTAVNATYVTEALGRFWNDAETDDGFGAYYTRLDGQALAVAGALADGWRIPDFTNDVLVLQDLFILRYSAGDSALGLRDSAGFNALSGGCVDPNGAWGYRSEQFALFLALGSDPGSVYYYGSLGATFFSAASYDATMLGTEGVDNFAFNLRLVREAPTDLVSNAVVRAKAFLSGSASSTTQETYTFVAPAPVVVPSTGVYGAAIDVTVSCALASAGVRYTLDGTDPTEASALYTGPLHLTTGVTPVVLKTAAFADGFEPSVVTTTTYVFTTTEPRTAKLRVRDFSLGSSDAAVDVTLMLD